MSWLEVCEMYLKTKIISNGLGENHLVAVPADGQLDFLERLIVLYYIMDSILIEERWNEYMVYTDKVWMMTMKEDKRCPLLENIIKEVEQVAVLLLVFQRVN